MLGSCARRANTGCTSCVASQTASPLSLRVSSMLSLQLQQLLRAYPLHGYIMADICSWMSLDKARVLLGSICNIVVSSIAYNILYRIIIS